MTEISRVRSILCIVCLYSWASVLYASVSPENEVAPCGDKQYYQSIRDLWDNRKPTYIEWIKQSDKTPLHLYYIQGETNNLLKYAAYCQDKLILDELFAVYLKALDALDETDQYVFYYYPQNQRRTVHRLKHKYRAWLDDKSPVGDETVLTSAQFLYVITESINIITDIAPAARSSIMRQLIRQYLPVVTEHYQRWIFSEVGPFQVRGWGCKMRGKYIKTGMNHEAFLKNKLRRLLGDSASPSYCNAVTDTDLWIIAGVSNLLAAYSKDKDLEKQQYIDKPAYYRYLQIGVDLISSRIIKTSLHDFHGKPVAGINFDVGAWDDHQNYRYAQLEVLDIFKAKPSKAKYPKNVGWDLSHARRFVHVFMALLNNREATGMKFPDRSVLEELGNQLLYTVFNGNARLPLFANFIGGSNGWFRVNYLDRKGFGYGPWDMSITMLTGGYGFLSNYNSNFESLFRSLLKMLASNDPIVLGHVEKHYERNHWENRKHVKSIEFSDKSNPSMQAVLIQFIPSLCYMHGIPH